jgi:formimidoylglutamase
VPHLRSAQQAIYDFVTTDSEYESWMANRIAPWDGQRVVDVALIGLPFDGAVLSWPGARFAPAEIRRTFMWFQTYNVEFDVDISDLELADFGDVEVLNTDIRATWERVDEALTSVRRLGIFPLTFGGDHSLEFPSVRSLCNVVDGNVGLIRIDTHEDMCHSGTGAGAGDQESSGVPVRKLLELPGSPVRPENVAMIGQHGWTHSKAYMDECKALGMGIYTPLDVRRRGMEEVVAEALARVCDGTKAVYFTLDVDALDAAFAPGTSAPTTAGLNPVDVIVAVHEIAKHPMVRGMDVMEVSPPLDLGKGLTSLMAGTMLMHMLGGLALRKQRGEL